MRAAESGDDWHPQVRHLLYHWLRSCSTDGRLPTRQLLECPGLTDLLPHLWLLDVDRNPWRFRYRMAGAAFTSLIGCTVGDSWYDEVRPQAWSANRSRLIATARDGMPTWRRGAAQQEADTYVSNDREIENLMLPIASDGVTVDAILGITMPLQPVALADDTLVVQ
ncbi:PAS domain-containing protein [Ferrovibrio terrae]|uniref:PAS domain-containing protein n=1 Tax=Ferrovibrio terrae TaxID=2594003 RepID=UPI0031380FE4